MFDIPYWFSVTFGRFSLKSSLSRFGCTERSNVVKSYIFAYILKKHIISFKIRFDRKNRRKREKVRTF